MFSTLEVRELQFGKFFAPENFQSTFSLREAWSCQFRDVQTTSDYRSQVIKQSVTRTEHPIKSAEEV